MNVLEVIPIAKGIPMETLSYFTASEVLAGSIITVPLRKKNISALVVSVHNVSDMKAEIRQSAFALKKIGKVESHYFLNWECIAAATDTAKYHAASTGAVLASLIPKNLIECAADCKPSDVIKKSSMIAPEKFAIQSNDVDRYAHYKSLVREEFARNRSVFIVVPTLQDISRAKNFLDKGIEQYVHTLHASMTQKATRDTVKKILEETHPVLIIATTGFLALPHPAIGTIIVERESSRAWKMQRRPHIDLRYFAEMLALRLRARVVFGDTLLRIETIWRHKAGELVELTPLSFRSVPAYPQDLIDMRTPKAQPEKNIQAKPAEKVAFKLLSDKATKCVEHGIEKSEHTFLFAARRGLSPSTVCADCGTVVTCHTCGAHTVLHSAKSGNFFLCHVCGERRDARERCSHCGGWRLTTLGIGTERLEKELKEKYPTAHIFRLDADSAQTPKQIGIIISEFYSQKGAILIGTEMALAYLDKPIENSIVVSLDTFFAIPDFRINERIMHILLLLRQVTSKHFIVQTRDPERKVFEYALAGNLIDFSKEEIDDRKMLNYPPFSTLIKFSLSGEKRQVIEELEDLQKYLAPYEINIFPAFIPSARGTYTANGIMRIPRADWPKKNLYMKLVSVPQNIDVEINPDSLLS